MMIASESLIEPNSSYLDNSHANKVQLEIRMLDLFAMLGCESAAYEQVQDISQAGITVNTPNGWQPIQALVRKHTAAARYSLANDLDVVCATKHLVFENGQCKTINTCASVDTITGPVDIIGSEYLGDQDLYDIAIPAPHVYMTTNGILHHNTTLAKCLFNELGVDDMDIKYVNASQNTGIDYLRSLTGFVETMPMGEFRYVLLDEADYLSPSSQAMLRNMMEEYSNICRWILTCNYPNKVIPALHSRTQGFHIEHLDRELFVERIATILIAEGVDLTAENLEILDEYSTATYPDLRKCINLLQQNCADGQLKRPAKGGGQGTMDYMIAAINLFKQGKIHEARKIVCANARTEDYEEIYKLLYRNLDWWGTTDDKQNAAIVIIANRLRDHSLVADAEINLAATLIELASL